MWKKELKRLFFDYKTLLIIILLIAMGGFGIWLSYQDKLMYISEYNSGAPDIDMARMKLLIDQYNGLKFDLDYFLQSDFFQMSTVILLVYIGVFLSSELHQNIESGRITMVLSRTSYVDYVKNLFLAQSLYIALILFFPFVVISAIGYVAGGNASGYTSVGLYEIDVYKTVLIIICQYILITVFNIVINGIGLFSNVFIRNKSVIQCLPFLMFFMIPSLLASTLGYIYVPIQRIFVFLIPMKSVLSIYYSLSDQITLITVIKVLLPVIFFAGVLIYIYCMNKKVFSKDCV